jgi:acyl-CoA synthetase (AMP-forming)/AMP-acid ligase II
MSSETNQHSFPEETLFTGRSTSVNILDFLKLHAQQQPNRAAYRWVDEKNAKENVSLTYGQLWTRITVIASHLRAATGSKKQAPTFAHFFFFFFDVSHAGENHRSAKFCGISIAIRHHSSYILSSRCPISSCSFFFADLGDYEAVVLTHEPGLEFLCAFYGCLLARVIAVPVAPLSPAQFRQQSHLLKQFLKDSKARYILTTTRYRRFTAFQSFTSGVPAKWLCTDEWTKPSSKTVELVGFFFLAYR